MDRIDILHEIAGKNGADIFCSREGKLRKALDGTALAFQDIENIVEVCTTDRKATKKILSEPELKTTSDLQKELVVELGGKSIAALRDIHTAIYHYEQKALTDVSGEFDDGRFVYTVVPARRQCLNLVRPLTPPAYDVTIPDTVSIDRKDYKVVSLADRCFEGCDKVTSVTLPVSLETIGKNAFCNCASLSKVEFPRHVKSIGDNAFAYTALEDIVFQDYLEEIGQMAFYGCRKLRTVDISKRTGQIAVGAFSGCTSLETITVSDKNGRFMFEDGVLYSRKQDRIVAVVGTFKGKLSPPRTLLTVEQYAAEGCEGLTELDLPSSITEICARSFRGCAGLTKVKFPNTLTRIGERAFENCQSLSSIDVPDSVKGIGKMAFAGCTSMKIADIDGTMKYRDLKMFDGCTGLNRVTIRKGSEYVDADFPKNTRVKFTHE